MRAIIVGPREAGQRVDKILGKYLDMAPMNFLYKMMRKKNILLNGSRCTGSEKPQEGDEIKLYLSDETIEKFMKKDTPASETPPLDILYEDHHMILVNKPPGLLSQKADKTEDSLVEYLTGYLLRSGQMKPEDLRTFHPAVCNRLDRNTSGIVAAGKTVAGLQTMSEALRSRTLHKRYLCIVAGMVEGEKSISGYLCKDQAANKVTVFSKRKGDQDLPIETVYRPLRSSRRLSFLEVDLITGRSHQIRAHLASIGHPIAGDYKYGDRELNERIKKKYGVASQLLHSFRMEMPNLREPLTQLSGRVFTAPVPAEFSDVLKGEGLWVPGIPEV